VASRAQSEDLGKMSVSIRSEAVRFWRLPWRFDETALQADLGRIDIGQWHAHFNTEYHDGGWSGLALISADGDAGSLYTGPDVRGAGRPTRLLDECPALRAVLAGLPFTIQCARLLRLAPASHIREHSDHGIGLDAGSVRLHVPIVTAPGVEFFVDGVRVPMAAGECWYLDLGLRHRVQNCGARERVHLVIDCAVDEVLRSMLPTPEASERQLLAVAQHSAPTSEQRFERFRAELLRRPDLQARLVGIDDAAELAGRVVQLGADHGITFTGEDVRSAIQAGRRAWIERNLPAEAAEQAAPAGDTCERASAGARDLDGWLPVLARAHGHDLTAELCQIGDRRFTEPFFEDSVAVCMRLPIHSLMRHRVDVAAMAAWLHDHPGLPPSGFVFHMSRCGSTLLAQVLTASPSHRVISEPGPVDTVLRDGPRPADDPQRIAWLQVLLGMLGQAANARERRFFVKFDSWHANQLPLIRLAYPEVPWIFLIRDPVEVIVSHLRRPGAQMVPGMLGFTPPGVDAVSAITMPREEYCARMLGAICDGALTSLERDPARGLIVDYADLTTTLHTDVLPHLGVRCSDRDADAVGEVLQRDAKNPVFEFRSDIESKQREASAAVRDAAKRWVMPAYQRLRDTAGA
jgi:Aspartyl/Asparaginyl beta-hydroxylase